MVTRAMFPLGTVLFPSFVLPLQVFEPRYRAMVADVLAGEREFGVCLIERGHEVGGGDVRTDVGTMATVQEAVEVADGRWAIVAVGTRRIRVQEWLEDAPYPRADVVDHPDPTPGPHELTSLPRLVERCRSALAKAGELGDPVPPATVELAADPALCSHQLCALAPISTFDRHRLLAEPGVGARLSTLDELLTDAHELLDLRLRGLDADQAGE